VDETHEQAFQPSFNSSLRVDFQGARVTSEGGLLLVRELDERLGLGELIDRHLADPRGENTQLCWLTFCDSRYTAAWRGMRMSTYNGHFESTCYHPLLLFNREGDCMAAKLRPGNVRSGEGWEELLLPEIERQQQRGKDVSSAPIRPSPNRNSTRRWKRGTAAHRPRGRALVCRPRSG
jgi:Transposase DDE domain group 1